MRRGMLAETKVSYDPTLHVPSAERDIVGGNPVGASCDQPMPAIARRRAAAAKTAPSAIGRRAEG
jgi:hypothetical protein